MHTLLDSCLARETRKKCSQMGRLRWITLERTEQWRMAVDSDPLMKVPDMGGVSESTSRIPRTGTNLECLVWA